MSSQWMPVLDRDKFGVAISNFLEDHSKKLRLFVGDAVHVLEENSGWYFGYCVKDKSVKGVFPKSFLHIKEAVIEKYGSQDVIMSKEPSVAHEITMVVREWGEILKHLYVTGNFNFERIRIMIHELVDYRKQVLSGTLPVDEMKKLKQRITAKIDMGNAVLGLDLVVRDEQGNILNPEKTSAIRLYRRHVESTNRVKKSANSSDYMITKPVTSVTHSLFVTVKNFVCSYKIGDDVELLLALYDAKDSRLISENYLIKWGKVGMMTDAEQISNYRVLFTDLDSKDLAREKIFLVCYIIRVGSLELKELDTKKLASNVKRPNENVRRPFGAAVIDVTDIINGKTENDDDKQHFLPFVQCGERDFLENVVRKLASTAKEVGQNSHKGQGLWVSMKLLPGDLKQVREESPHLVSVMTSTARKMGFPEVILPGDIRNDLYLTIGNGEFAKGNKSSDKNVQVTVTAVKVVKDEKVQLIDGVISIGGSSEPIKEYNSVVYYHEDRPKWFETFKIAIPIEEFYGAHLKFTFKHRSSSEAKDRAEKPFALAYVKLVQENGTTLTDATHDLVVYKIDGKKYEEDSISYIKFPSTRPELDRLRVTDHRKFDIPGGLSISGKDSFSISTLVCSTKLTKNVDLLGLLKCSCNQSNMEESLNALLKVDGEEVVKFLQDTLDALFSILMKNTASDIYDNSVFDSLVFIIMLVLDRKYHHFRPVLDRYIKENFSATLAYIKLLVVLNSCVDSVSEDQSEIDRPLRAIKSLQYIIKFIVRSREHFAKLNEGKDQEEFEEMIVKLFKSFAKMMSYKLDNLLKIQATCLKFLPTTVADIITVFRAKDLSSLLMEIIDNIPCDRLTSRKLYFIRDIVRSDIFSLPDCRQVLLPSIINNHLRPLLNYEEENVDGIDVLSDILEELYCFPVESVKQDVSVIMLSILRTIIQSVIHTDRRHAMVGIYVAVMIDILRQMQSGHYVEYICHFPTRSDLLDFLMEILMVFKDLVGKTVFPIDWNEMIMLQNSVILKALRHYSHTIRDKFSSPFECQVWNNFFHGAIAFLTQDALQLETFSSNKRNKIITRYKDMRRETGFEIRAMWFNLGSNKIQFVPDMVGPILEMTLIPEMELRKATIPIFLDMMQCEFYSNKVMHTDVPDEVGVEAVNRVISMYQNREIKGNFRDFENEIITKLDVLVEGGKGDMDYKDLFYKTMKSLCETHATMRDQGLKFVKVVTLQLERLLDYRHIACDEVKENRMSAIVNLLDFYNEINRKEMYIRYLHKLCDLHLDCQNYVEAAFTLILHANLLKWSDDPLPKLLKYEKLPGVETHREVKEKLYNDIIKLFDQGKLWEASLTMCDELVVQYRNEIYDYKQLSALLTKMSEFYDNIMTKVRPEPEYFRVSFYGRGFPTFMQNKTFVFRGKEYEKLDEFCGRLQNQFSNAQLMTKLTPPDDTILESQGQYLQINKVDPIMQDQDKFAGKVIHHQILKYYKVNDVQHFTFSRILRRGPRDSENEFGNLWLEKTNLVTTQPLPGILRWFPVKSTETIEVSPLQNAIDTMTSKNNKIKEMVQAHQFDECLPINPLGMLLNGVVDAAVMGGISNYEFFFTDEYKEKNNSPEDCEKLENLKDLIACQIPLLEAGIAIHKERIPSNLRPFHDRIEQCFVNMKTSVEAKYGKRAFNMQSKPLAMRLSRRKRPMTSLPHTPRLSESNFSLNSSPQPSPVKVPSTPRLSTYQMRASVASLAKNRKSNAEGTLRRNNSESQSQWYDDKLEMTSSSSNMIELSEQLVPHRPLRSEAEKRFSRPNSGQFKNVRLSSSPTSKPEGGASMQSLDSIPDEGPPPLPQKTTINDYCNLPEGVVTSPNRNYRPYSSLMRPKNKPLPPLPVKEKKAPIPPKKPSREPPNGSNSS